MGNSPPNLIDSRHPVLRQEYAIYTPPMSAMITKIGNWLDQRASGGYIFGPSRFGKSRCVKWHLKLVLEERFRAPLPLVIWIRRESAMTEGEFWNSQLGASKYEFHDPLKPKKKVVGRFLFEERLATMARAAHQSYVVLLIDEAHSMTLNEWKWLLGLQNSLDYRGIRFSVFSVGSHNILFQPNYLARTGNAHVAARFFPDDMQFHGLASEEELKYVLNGYDVDSEWPKKSGISYLQYFAPDSFASGERLQNCTDTIWTAFNKMLPPSFVSNKNLHMEIPMQHLANAIENALRRLALGKEWSEVTSYESWLEMIAETHFTDHMRKISTVE